MKAWIAIGALALLALGLAFGRTPAPLAGTATRAWLRAGAHEIAHLDLEYRDETRPTLRADGVATSPHRDLPGTVWFPRDGAAYPLIVQSHGFSGNRYEAEYLALAFARLGYVVMAADYPLTKGSAPDGPDISDVVNQPGDVRFLLDRLLEANADPDHPLRGKIDPERIGAVGVSLGGLTTTLVGLDPDRHDPRIRAIASLAGPTSLFAGEYFAHHPLPMLLVAGTADAVVDYAANAPRLLDLLPGSLVVSIRDGSHTGFGQRGGLLRWFDHPDRVLCWLLQRRLERAGELPFERIGNRNRGILVPDHVGICEGPVTARAMNPIRQRWLVELAVTRFFEAQFQRDPAVRAESWSYLTEGMTREIPEITARYSPRRDLAVGPSGR